jgi:hypothetical protein
MNQIRWTILPGIKYDKGEKEKPCHTQFKSITGEGASQGGERRVFSKIQDVRNQRFAVSA